MAALTKLPHVSLGIDTSARHLPTPINPLAQLEVMLERKTLEVSVLEYFWSR